MINGKQVGIGEILWRVVANPYLTDVTIDSVAEHALNFLKLMKAPLAMTDKVKSIELFAYKGLLPDNLINIRGVRYTGLDGCDKGIPMRYATDIYHQSPSNEDECATELTYVIQGCNIITSVEEGYIEISYSAIEVDEDGFPLIPDNESLKRALEYFIIFKYIEPLWSIGKVPDKVFSYYDTQANWYYGQASNAFKLANVDHLESTMNAINRIILSAAAHKSGFKNLGEKEHFKRFR